MPTRGRIGLPARRQVLALEADAEGAGGRRGIRARGRALQGERGRATLLEAGEDLPGQPARDRDHDLGRLRAGERDGLGAKLELLRARLTLREAGGAGRVRARCGRTASSEQLALQTADSVSRGFLARRRCVLRPLSLSCERGARGSDDAAARVGAAAGWSRRRRARRSSSCEWRACRRRCRPRRARGRRSYVRPRRDRCSPAGRCTASRPRCRGCIRSRRPSGELKPKAAFVAVVLPDGPESIARVGAVASIVKLRGTLVPSVARRVGLPARAV